MSHDLVEVSYDKIFHAGPASDEGQVFSKDLFFSGQCAAVWSMMQCLELLQLFCFHEAIHPGDSTNTKELEV